MHRTTVAGYTVEYSTVIYPTPTCTTLIVQPSKAPFAAAFSTVGCQALTKVLAPGAS